MTRDELLDAAVIAMYGPRGNGVDPRGDGTAWSRVWAARIVDAIEPLIRTDEQKKVFATLVEQGHLPALLADERERIAQAIEAMVTDPDTLLGALLRMEMHSTARDAVMAAALIARNGGGDE